MRLGIVLGVSNYTDPKNNLPACKNDAELMTGILRKSNQYEHILSVIDETKASLIKQRIIKFIEQFRHSEVSEVFFYYTGHGEYFEEEFYYQLGDFSTSRRNQTSLQNSELDNLLRQLSPKLTVKVIDACQSGVPYIKDFDVFEKYLENGQHGFDRCYFMFSSQRDELSYQDKDLSAFTRAFARALFEFGGSTIRYKDIIDSIADHFQQVGDQIPYFVMQAQSTESFINKNDAIEHFLGEQFKQSPLEVQDIDSPPKKSLLDNVKEDANRFCTLDELIEVLQHASRVVGNHEFGQDFNSLFKIEVDEIEEIDGYEECHIPNIRSVGLWLDKHEHEYFAQATWKKGKKKEGVPNKNYGLLPFESKTRIITKTISRIVGFELNQIVPIEGIYLQSNPNYPNIEGGVAIFLFVFSKTKIRFFVYVAKKVAFNWEEDEIEENLTWKTKAFATKDKKGITDYLGTILSEFEEMHMEAVKV